MKKCFIDDKEMKTINQMNEAYELIYSIMENLHWENNVSTEDDIMKYIRSAWHDFGIGMNLFIAENVMDYDEWIKNNNKEVLI